MYRFSRLFVFLCYATFVSVHDEEAATVEPLTLLEVAALPDDAYAELFGYDRHGALVLREGETLERDDGWAGDLDRGVFGGDAAGAGGAYD